MQDNKSPLFSVIIPAYNAEKYILNSIKSVTDQENDDVEIIVVNDGSVDSTEEKIKKIAQKDDRIKYFYKTNGGVSSARNFALKKARGKWVLFLDADDTLNNGALNHIAEMLHKYNDVDLIITPIDAISGKHGDKRETKRKIQVDKLDIIDDIIYQLPDNLINGSVVARSACGKIIKRSVIVDNYISFIDGLRFFEDGIFSIVVSYHSNKIIFWDYSFYTYDTSNKSSRMNTFCPEIIEDNKIIYDTIKRFLDDIDHNSTSFPYLCVELFSTTLFAIFMEKTKTKCKIEKIKSIKRIYLDKNKKRIKAQNLSKVLKIEYLLARMHLYRLLLLFNGIKLFFKRLRGRV